MTSGTPYPSAPPPPPLYQPRPRAYAPLGGRLTALKVVFWLMVATTVAAAVSGVFEIALMDRLIAGEDVADSEIDNNDIRHGLISLAQFATMIACMVVFIVWLFRAYKNVDYVAPGARRYETGWAIGAWFVPILNLFRPKQIINDIWRAGTRRPEPPALFAIWWVLWIVSSWISNFGGRDAFSGQTPEELRNGAMAYLASDVLTVVTAILAIHVASTLTRHMEDRAAEGPPPMAPPPNPADRMDPPSSGDIPWRPPPPPLGSGGPY